MQPVLVDSNVLLDIVTSDPIWFDWSSGALEASANQALLVVNPLIFAEVSIAYGTIEAVEAALPTDIFRREPLPYEVAEFLAGKAFLQYRKTRWSTLGASAGLLHWGACRGGGLPTAHPGRHALQNVLPKCEFDFTP
jgi:hypothetical protein